MNIVFFGSSDFAMPSLRALLGSGHRVLALITQPDRKKGRSLKLSPPPTKVLANANGIAVYQPEDVSSFDSVEYLKILGADLFVVVSFGQILKKKLLDVPRLFPINLHGSILPKYRGAAPVNRAVMQGEPKTGVTVIRMNERMDAGDIIAVKEVPIGEEDTSLTMSEKLAEEGALLVLKTIGEIGSGSHSFLPQDEASATYAPKLTKADGLIRWDMEAAAIHNLVRGLIPWPGAYTYCGGKVLKIFRTEVPARESDQASGAPGEVTGVVRGKGIEVRTGSGNLIITHLQLEGKKVLDAEAFVRGQRIGKGTVFTHSPVRHGRTVRDSTPRDPAL